LFMVNFKENWRITKLLKENINSPWAKSFFFILLMYNVS
jgi:hypothetical protein